MVFVIEKSLIVIIFIYCISTFTLVGQFVIADVFGMTLRNFQGQEVKSNLVNIINVNQFNTIANNVTSQNQRPNLVNLATQTLFWLNIAWEVILLLTGMQIFNFIYLMGVPWPVVVVIIIPYIILLARTVIGYIRGI